MSAAAAAAAAPEPIRLPFSHAASANSSTSPLTMLTTYLLSHLERRAALLCHGLLTDLERCLLRSHRRRGFDFFPVAVLLLTCVERMEWFVLTFASGDKAKRVRIFSPLSYSTLLHLFQRFWLFRIFSRRPPNPRANIVNGDL